jgi:hypothetical protein
MNVNSIPKYLKAGNHTANETEQAGSKMKTREQVIPADVSSRSE